MFSKKSNKKGEGGLQVVQSMLPIYVLNNPEDVSLLPRGEGHIYFVISRDGIYMYRKMGMFEAMVKVNDISFLQPIQTFANMDLPLLPAELIIQALSFFRWAQKQFGTESIVLPYYSEVTDEFVLMCPEQGVGHANVKYTPLGNFGDFQGIGTIHSHNNFGAFHSSIDKNDEKHDDGLHITIGDVNRKYPTITSTVVVSNNRFPVSPLDVIGGLVEIGDSHEANGLVPVAPVVVGLQCNEAGIFEEENPAITVYGDEYGDFLCGGEWFTRPYSYGRVA